jgi:Flp pilus assembly protein TadB
MSEVVSHPILLILAAGVALGVFVAVSRQPLGQPRLDPVVRIRRLDPDLLWAEQEPTSGTNAGVFSFLEPLRLDALRLTRAISEAVGLGLNAREAELLDGDSVADHYLQRLTTPLVYVALALLLSLVFNVLGVWHGLWPWWVWLAVCGLGFVMPHLLERGKLGRHRQELIAGLPRLADLLAIAASGGAGIELASQNVSPYLAGPLGSEWGRMCRQLRRGGVALPEALEELASRNAVPEVDRLVELLVAAYAGGTSVAPRLRQLASSWRQDRLRGVQADAGRASETMFLPVMLGIFVPLMILVVAPGAAAFIRLLVS